MSFSRIQLIASTPTTPNAHEHDFATVCDVIQRPVPNLMPTSVILRHLRKSTLSSHCPVAIRILVNTALRAVTFFTMYQRIIL